MHGTGEGSWVWRVSRGRGAASWADILGSVGQSLQPGQTQMKELGCVPRQLLENPGGQWLLAPGYGGRKGQKQQGSPGNARNQSTLGAWGLPCCEAAGRWGPLACFIADLPARAQPQLGRPPRHLDPSFVKQGCGQEPLQGRKGPLAQCW